VNIRQKFILGILAIILSSTLVLTSCTGAISRGWAGGTIYNGTIFIASMNGKIIAIDSSNDTTLGAPIQLSVVSSSGILSCSSSSVPLVIYASPVVVNTPDPGTVVYVGGYQDDKIHGFLFKDGALVEKNPTFLSDQLNGQIVGGIAVDNNTLYFATSDGTVYSLNAKDLSVNWSHKINSKIWSAPTVDGDTLYIGCFNKTVYALNIADGTEKWQYKTDGSINSTPVIYNNTVYIGDYDRHFYALDAATGNLVWKFPGDGTGANNPKNFFWAKPVEINGLIYAPNLDGNVYALDAATGNLVHEYELGDSIASSPVAFGTNGNYLAVATSVASTDPKKQRGTVYVINTTDTTKKDIVISASSIPSFSLPTNAPGQAHENINAPLFAQGNTVYVHTTRDNLYPLDTAAKGSQPINLSTVK
jgi:outer membrane protein assembly factor BamB